MDSSGIRGVWKRANVKAQPMRLALNPFRLPIECGGFSGSVNPHADVANGQNEYKIGTT
jgi:hypothetical protein